MIARRTTTSVVVLLVAFALRAGRLDFQSLWYDEGSSLYLSRQSLGAITNGTAHDIHPPLYYYFLHFWMAAAGQGEYAVRFLSLLAGVLIVALLYVLGRRLLGASAGAMAALAGAVSPLLVYYSQETRMYAQVTLFGLLSTYLLVRATEQLGRKAGAGAWPAYFAASAACLYSQYIGALVLAFQGLYGLFVRRKALLPFVAAAAATVLVFVPWLAIAKDSLLSWPSTDAFHAGPRLFGDAAFRYVEGLSAGATPLTVAFTAAVVAIAGFGFAFLAFFSWVLSRPGLRLTSREPLTEAAQRRVRQALTRTATVAHNVWLPALYVAVPLLAMFLLGYRKPVYNPKFALLALPGFLLLVGAGLASLGNLRVLGIATLLASAGYALNNYYANPQFARDDYRGIANFIATSGRPGDAIILDAPGQEQIFPYYYRGSLPQVGLPQDRPLSPDKTAATLQDLNGQYQRLWLVLYGTNGSDPDAFVEHWLASQDFEVQNQWFGNVRLAAFAVPSGEPAAPHAADATLGGFAHLSGYSLTPQPAPSGDVLQLGLEWQASGRAPGNEKVFTHVVDAEGNIWAQRDSDPAGGARPTSSWQPGETIDDNYGLLVLPGTPPGHYQAEIGMYDPASPTKLLPVSAGGEGDRLLLGGIQVTPAPQPPSLDELRIPHPLDGRLGPIRLLGWSLTLVGQDAERASFAAGDEAHLTLFWQADGQSASDAQLSLQMGSSETLALGPLLPQHPTSTWQAGDRYRDQHRFKLPAAGGDLDLAVRLDGQSVPLTRIHIR
ncbi:MAG: glycosyltransferase family 39 protein [Chloroflexota bacterium]